MVEKTRNRLIRKDPWVRIPNSPPKIHRHSLQRQWIFLFIRLGRGFLFKMSRTGSYPHYYCVEWWYLPFLPEIFWNRWSISSFAPASVTARAPALAIPFVRCGFQLDKFQILEYIILRLKSFNLFKKFYYKYKERERHHEYFKYVPTARRVQSLRRRSGCGRYGSGLCVHHP